jgi:peptidoglycan L-alanyl-D-glutamate endopeptidase CwlK
MNWNPLKWLKDFLLFTATGSAKHQNLEILKLYPDTCDMQLDERTLKVLNTLDPKVKGAFAAFTIAAKTEAAKLGCEYIAINGTRTWNEQAALYAKGRTTPGNIVTRAKPGYSWHNFGLAVDFGVFKDGKYLDSTNPKLATLVHASAATKVKDFDIEWGGNWRTFKDIPHYQKVPSGLTLAAARKRHQEGKPIV